MPVGKGPRQSIRSSRDSIEPGEGTPSPSYLQRAPGLVVVDESRGNFNAKCRGKRTRTWGGDSDAIYRHRACAQQTHSGRLSHGFCVCAMTVQPVLEGMLMG